MKRALLLAVLLAPAAALAASNARSFALRIPCPAPSSNNGRGLCFSLNGWFDGRVDWVSGNLVLYSEFGPFYAAPSDKELLIYADANGSASMFEQIYLSPLTSVLEAPDLHVRLYSYDSHSVATLVFDQPYVPAGSALWSVHSEDTFRLDAAIAAQGNSLTAYEQKLAAPGTVNAAGNPVDWTELKNVPSTVGGGVASVGAQAPLASSGGQNPVVSLGVVPVDHGGTGASSFTPGSFLSFDGAAVSSSQYGPTSFAPADGSSDAYVRNGTSPQPNASFSVSTGEVGQIRVGWDYAGNVCRAIQFATDDGDDPGAGRIGYKLLGAGKSLDIVGAGGKDGAPLSVKLWDDVEVAGDLQVGGRITGDGSGLTNLIQPGSVSNDLLQNQSISIAVGGGLSGGGTVALGGGTTISIPPGGVTNDLLANNSVTVEAGSGLSGGGPAALGGKVKLSVAPAAITNDLLAHSSVSVNPGAGLSGGGSVDLGGSATLGIAPGGVSNDLIANPSVTIAAGEGLQGGGQVPLGGTAQLSIPAGGVSNDLLAHDAITLVTGSGLTGSAIVPLGGTAILGIAPNGVGNDQLANSQISIDPGAGLTGGGPVSLGGSVPLSIADGAVTSSMVAPGTYGIDILGNASTAASFSGDLTGDVSGGMSSTSVTALQHRAVSPAAPSDGQVLSWSDAAQAWQPAAAQAGAETSLLDAAGTPQFNLGPTLTLQGSGSTTIAFDPVANSVTIGSAAGSGGSGSVEIDTGAGLAGGPISSTGTISIAAHGVTNTMLQNSSVTVAGGTGITVTGSPVDLGGTVTIANSDTGSSQKIFKHVAGPGGPINAGSNDDTLSFASGSGLSLLLDSVNKKVSYSIGAGAITNSMLQWSSVTVVAGAGLSGGGTVGLGGATALALNLGTNTTLSGAGSVASPLGINLAAANTWTGAQTFQAGSFSGNGAGLTSLNASAFSTGTMPVGRGGTGAATAPQNTVFAAPTSGSGAPSFRALVAADLPSGGANYIQNQTTATQPASFWLSGDGTVGRLGVGGPPSSPLQVSSVYTTNDAQIQNVTAVASQTPLDATGFWQSFKVVHSGFLHDMQVRMAQRAAGNITLSVYAGIGTGGQLLATATLSSPITGAPACDVTAGYASVAFSSAGSPSGVPVTGGQSYTFALTPGVSANVCVAGDTYADGVSSSPGNDAAFTVNPTQFGYNTLLQVQNGGATLVNGRLLVNAGMTLSRCPAGLDTISVNLSHGTQQDGPDQFLCASDPYSDPPTGNLHDLLAGELKPFCDFAQHADQVVSAAGADAIATSISVLTGLIEQGFAQGYQIAGSSVQTLLNTTLPNDINTKVLDATSNGINNKVIGPFNGGIEGGIDVDENQINTQVIDKFNAAMNKLSLPNVPHIPLSVIADVPPMSIPHIGNYNLTIPSTIDIPALDITQTAQLQSALKTVYDLMKPQCVDAGTVALTLMDYVGKAYVAAGDLPSSGFPTSVPTYKTARDHCAADGAHVCTKADIMTLTGGAAMSSIGYGIGDWVGTGAGKKEVVMFPNVANEDFPTTTPWPPVTPDLTALIQFHLPFKVTPPVMPSGNYRCCLSANVIQ